MSKNINVLIINHAFPPDTGVETYRVSKFAKYLSSLGCEIYVLTQDNNVKYRCEKYNRIEYKITRTSISSLPIVKSDEIRWIRPLIKNTTKIIKEQDIDVIFHSAPHFMPLLSSIPITKSMEIPYIIDLRDPWTVGPSLSENNIRGRAYDKISSVIESRIFGVCEAVIMNTSTMEKLYSQKYPTQSHKFYTIPNGYDPDDYNYDYINQIESNQFDVVYPGKFYTNMKPFFKAFAKFSKKSEDISFNHYGYRNSDYITDIKTMAREEGFYDCIAFNGYTDRREVLRILKRSNIGIVDTRKKDPTHVPMKTYDYIGGNIPILAIDDGDGALRDMLGQFQNGYVVNRNDPYEIYSTLESIYNSGEINLGNKDSTLSFSIENLTQKLWEVITKSI